MLIRTRVAIIKTGKKSTVPVPLSLLQNQWCWLVHNNCCCLTGLETWLTGNWRTRVTCLGWRVSRRHLHWILHRRVSCDWFLRHLSGATVIQDLNISWDANEIRVLRVCLYSYLCLGGVTDPAIFQTIFCRGGHGFESRWSPDTLQASSFQLLKLEHLLRWSLFTFIYNRSTNMTFTYISHYFLSFDKPCQIIEFVIPSLVYSNKRIKVRLPGNKKGKDSSNRFRACL